MQQIQDTGQQLKLIVIKLDIRNPIDNKFLIWDDYHPTTVAHQIIADTALAAIEAKSVPKPPTQVGTLLAVGTFGAVGVLKRQQKRSALTTADLVSSAQSSHTVDKKYLLMWDYDRLFQIIAELVMHHSPSGAEAEINQLLIQRFTALGVEVWCDRADNIIAKIPGQSPDRAIAITAHKDEIGAIVKTLGDEGRVEVRKLGGSFPWIYGEGVVDLLGDNETISGILSFGSRHVSHESPQKVQQEDTSVKWENAWIETKRTTAELEAAGIRPGTRMVIGKHRKLPIRLKDHIASYTLDNKASVAILLALAEGLKQPAVDVYLVASAKEEVGAIGALFFTQNQPLDALIALEICPLSEEYPVKDGEIPVLLSQDAYGIYDEGLNAQIRQCAKQLDVPIQFTTLSGFGSDASIAMKFGHVGRAACLAFPTQNTHGYEIAHLGAIAHCIDLLKAFCQTEFK